MLCRRCHRRLDRDATICGACGSPRPGVRAPLELALDDGTLVPLVGELTIGRAPGMTLRLEDPSVSRRHARIIPADDASEAILEDAGSSYGTFLDGSRITAPTALYAGAELQLGDARLTIQARSEQASASRTIIVPLESSLVLPSAGGAPHLHSDTGSPRSRPRVRSGHALKRVEGDTANGHWVLRDLRLGGFLRLDDDDAQLLQLLDGTATLGELLGAAEQRLGPRGRPRLTRLLADLGERGLLSGVDSTASTPAAARGWLRRMVGPHTWSTERAGPAFEALYRAGGWLLFTIPALVLGTALAFAGAVAFAALVVTRYGTPFVVASHIGLGGLVFLLGRGLLVALHETAHGLALASVGRRVRRAGLKLVLIFPYAFVDISELWFEPRARRITATAAGPASDLVVGGTFAILCAALPATTLRDVAFQIAFAAYVGALFNLNPFLDRDGYQILTDVLGIPGLRARARDELRRRRGGKRTSGESVLVPYALAGVAWSVVMAGFGVALSLRYAPVLRQYASAPVVWALLATAWAAMLVPVVLRAGPHAAPREGPPGGATGGGGVMEGDADRAAEVLERILVDPAFRVRFREDPTATCREAGLDHLAAEIEDASLSGKAMHTLADRESRSSLAGVMMAAAVEGIGVAEFAHHVVPLLERAPRAVRDVVARMRLPTIRGHWPQRRRRLLLPRPEAPAPITPLRPPRCQSPPPARRPRRRPPGPKCRRQPTRRRRQWPTRRRRTQRPPSPPRHCSTTRRSPSMLRPRRPCAAAISIRGWSTSCTPWASDTRSPCTSQPAMLRASTSPTSTASR